MSCLGDERHEDIPRVREVRPRDRTVDRQIVAHRGGGFVSERSAPDMEQEGCIEGVGDVLLGHAQLTGESGADQARAHRRLRPQPEAEIGDDREPTEEVRETHASGHAPILTLPSRPEPSRIVNRRVLLGRDLPRSGQGGDRL